MAGAVYIVQTDLNHNVQGSTEKAFVFNDHLGSTDVIADNIGTVIQSQSYDAWGQRRKADTWELLSPAGVIGFNTGITKRGYTGHEQLDELGLIHMNGRVYDPKLGRFLQADPIIQAASNTQSYNRYSYVWNNPLNATDPSGYSLSSLWDEVRPFVGAVVAVALCVAASCAGSAEAMFWIGGVSGAAGAAANGGGIGDIITGGLLGAFSGAAAGVGAGMAGQLGGFVGAGFGGALSANVLGGSMGQGFISAGVGGLFGGVEGVRGFAVAAIAGGVISEITGGKFKNGAATAAFMWALRAGVSKYAGNEQPLPSAEEIKAVEERILASGQSGLTKEELLARVRYVDSRGRAISGGKFERAMSEVLSTEGGRALVSAYLGGAPDDVMLTVKVVAGGGSRVVSQGTMTIDVTGTSGGLIGNDFNYFKAVGADAYIKSSLVRTMAHELYHATSPFARSNEVNAVIAENMIMRQISPNAGVRDGYNNSVKRYSLPADGYQIYD